MNIKELAKKLGLSITTVSRALGGYSDVSEKTRERVKKFANKYQYSPNPYASVLASGRTKTVGYVLPIYGTNASTLNQGNFFQFIAGMSDELLSESIQLQILFAKSEDEEIKAYEKLILEQKIENIVLQNIKTKDITVLKKIVKSSKIEELAKNSDIYKKIQIFIKEGNFKPRLLWWGKNLSCLSLFNVSNN